MQSFNLVDNLYVYPTPGGAYHAISAAEQDPPRQFLRALLQHDTTPALTIESIKNWTGMSDTTQASELVHRAQQLLWIQGVQKPITCPDQPLEDILPSMLGSLTDDGKVLLSDSQGFYLAASGFPHEVAEELSALSADLASLNERRSGLLINNLGLGSGSWGLVDAAGCSKVGFWPLHIGKQRFVLVVSGIPRFNQPEFVNLVWTLSMRYAPSTLN